MSQGLTTFKTAAARFPLADNNAQQAELTWHAATPNETNLVPIRQTRVIRGGRLSFETINAVQEAQVDVTSRQNIYPRIPVVSLWPRTNIKHVLPPLHGSPGGSVRRILGTMSSQGLDWQSEYSCVRLLVAMRRLQCKDGDACDVSVTRPAKPRDCCLASRRVVYMRH